MYEPAPAPPAPYDNRTALPPGRAMSQKKSRPHAPEEAALLAAIVACPDEDTPRLIYADWLDEHRPDPTPSPAPGPSARAEYIRVQCRLAARPYSDPDYPDLLEREEDLADWLKVHTSENEDEPPLPDKLEWFGEFDSGDDREYSRGFPDEFHYTDFEEEPQENIDAILAALPEAFAGTTVRTLRLEDAYGSEVAGVVARPPAAGLRGLILSDLDQDEELGARAVAESPHLGGLRRLVFDGALSNESMRVLAKSKHLRPEFLSVDFPAADGVRLLAQARWFRNLRSLRVWVDSRDTFRALADLPAMPNLVALEVRGGFTPTTAAVRRFAASKSFPRLARLEFAHARFSTEQVAALCRAEWPLRHLRASSIALRKGGAEALADAAFADALRVLELPECQVPGGGVQALAASPRLAGLRHLDLSRNPVGPGGLLALARSRHLGELRKLSLAYSNSGKAKLDAKGLFGFLSALQTPELRHLYLDGLPVGVRGGRAIGGGAFPRLTRLSLGACGLRENGCRAIVESAALPDVAVLVLSDNGGGKGVAKLADPATFPRLATANVAHNRVPKGILSRLRNRPGVHT